jgi:hypothetical protein
MKVPKVNSGFGFGNILGLIFVLVGVLLSLTLTGYELPYVGNFNIVLQYGAALGSILGGMSMLFKKKTVSQIQVK